MKTTYTINGKRISKKQLEAKLGKERVERFTEDAAELFAEEPSTELSYFVGCGILTIQFVLP